MARQSKIAGRATGGFVLAILAALFWISDQHRLAIFVALAMFVPYLVFLAPFNAAATHASGTRAATSASAC